MQTLVFDPGGYKGHLRVYPFFGNMARVTFWRGSRLGAAGGDLEGFLAE